jgi:hypothetical protein
MQRAAATDPHIRNLDLDEVAQEQGSDVETVRNILSDLLVEQLVEEYAVTYDDAPTEAPCRITAAGMRYLSGR